MNIQLEKALIIDQLKHVDDADLIHALQSLLNNTVKKENIPDMPAHGRRKDMLRQRATEMRTEL